ncbi:sterol desaturase family protein [Novosphingobium sp. ERN07]|uniref:sterol desaturase family protein n=1 Tax=Novosphingobium sp. ERN07 TaxID=2726187 RepID=UPI001F0E3617|nr:sterol desaturase family protein [Novosphingobium sp. ERN07]
MTVAGFFAVEFAYYWFHRFSHTVRWMWATHAVHHSSREYVLPSAVRLGWTEFFSLGWTFFAALVLIGFPPTVVAVLLGANLIYQFPLHTEAVRRLPNWVEAVFNTPSHHRAHHASETEFLDCNFGGVLIVWDRVFGTFRAEPHDRALRYGLVHDLDSRNPVRIALHEWRRLFGDIARARGKRCAAPTLRG